MADSESPPVFDDVTGIASARICALGPCATTLLHFLVGDLKIKTSGEHGRYIYNHVRERDLIDPLITVYLRAPLALECYAYQLLDCLRDVKALIITFTKTESVEELVRYVEALRAIVGEKYMRLPCLFLGFEDTSFADAYPVRPILTERAVRDLVSPYFAGLVGVHHVFNFCQTLEVVDKLVEQVKEYKHAPPRTVSPIRCPPPSGSAHSSPLSSPLSTKSVSSAPVTPSISPTPSTGPAPMVAVAPLAASSLVAGDRHSHSLISRVYSGENVAQPKPSVRVDSSSPLRSAATRSAPAQNAFAESTYELPRYVPAVGRSRSSTPGDASPTLKRSSSKSAEEHRDCHIQ